MKYAVKNFKEYNSGKMQGFFTLQIDDFDINDMKCMQGDDGNLWAAFPSRMYEDKDGTKKYTNIVYIENEDRRKAFQKWVGGELKKIIPVSETPQAGTPPMDDDIPF